MRGFASVSASVLAPGLLAAPAGSLSATSSKVEVARDLLHIDATTRDLIVKLLADHAAAP